MIPQLHEGSPASSEDTFTGPSPAMSRKGLGEDCFLEQARAGDRGCWCLSPRPLPHRVLAHYEMEVVLARQVPSRLQLRPVVGSFPLCHKPAKSVSVSFPVSSLPPKSNFDFKFPKKTILVRNDSSVTEFLLAGLTDRPELQQPLFFLFLMIYIVTVVGNLGLIILIGLDSHLHTPMYYFLFNLSFIDLCYSSVFTPKMLMNFVSRENIISYVGCMTQLFFFLFFVISECYMLTSMAYDRYVAICHPLLYRVTMSHQVCCLLTVAAYMMGFAGASAHTGCMLRLTFCHVNIINHYLCDILPLLQLSCTSTYVNEVVVLIVVGINITVPSFTILISYVFILTSILHIRSAQGRSKAFSTCSSHIIALSLFFGSAAFMYLKYSSPGSMEQGKVSSVFYTNVGPMLNPLIYSLRNKDVKIAFRKALIKIWSRNMF
ncbi:olfactory receptor 8B3 [Mustela nigripes]|uniref:olfactory receptor 8B3 n=1 Tax=Mustela nigripes TaxID=77151 RepID=UPI0028165BA3|nr:olfactory receptor 8B3 [Mustela nigripes]